MVHVKYAVSKGHLCPKTIATFVQINGLNLAKRWIFAPIIQDTNVIGLKFLTTGTNVTTVLCVQGKIKSGLKFVLIETDVATHTYKLFFRKEPERKDINILL